MAIKTGTGTSRKGTGTGKKGTGRKGTGAKKRGYTMSDKALAIRKENFGVMTFSGDEGMEYNRRLLAHTLQTKEIAQSSDKSDPESMRRAFLAYVKLCGEDGFRIGNMGACAAMGIDLSTLHYWAKGERRAQDPAYKALAEFVMSVCSTAREQLISDGKINPLIGIFWQRNFDGLRNDTESIQDEKQTDDDDGKTASEYIEKYGELTEN